MASTTEKHKTITIERYKRKTFTTHRKKPRTTINISRKGSIVKERCKQLTEILRKIFPGGIVPEEDLVNFIEDYIGADKETIRAYKGYNGHIRAGRCGDNKVVGLSRKGYLQKFGFLKKLPGRRWLICQQLLTSKDMTVGIDSKEKISISTSQRERARENRFEKVVSPNKERKEEEDTEKERNFTPKIFPKISELGLSERAVFYAVPCDEPDKAKVSWEKQAPVIRELEEASQ